MHFGMILAAGALALLVRLTGHIPTGTWRDRWQQTLGLFLFSPLLLLTTALAVVCMGPQGDMLGLSVGWSSYGLAIAFLLWSGVTGLYLSGQGWRSLHQIRTYPLQALETEPGRILPTETPFAAQVGFWQPELVVSQGLFTTLTPEQLKAVLTHEQAHTYYRDTFWFFWLGWLRHVTAWLPQTEPLWQELLMLRELRADGWAAQRVDALLLAESLLRVAQAPLLELEDYCAAFSCAAPVNRLEARIEALINQPPSPETAHIPWFWLLWTLFPLITVPFHS